MMLLYNVSLDYNSLTMPNNAKKLNIAHLNIRSIRNKTAELIHFISTNSIDIMSVNETYLTPSVKISIKNYTILRRDRSNKKGGGVCLIVHQSIDHSIIDIDGLDNNDELLVIELPSVLVDQQKLVLATYYNAPNQTVKISILDKIFKISKNTILLGDLNAHHEDWLSVKSNESGKVISGFLNDNELVLVNKLIPTYQPIYRTNYTSIIDLAISDEITYDSINDFNTCDSLNSDHLTISFSLNHNGDKVGTPPFNTNIEFKVSCCHLGLLEEELKRNSKLLNYDELKCAKDIDDLTQKITEIITRSVKDSTFSKNLKINASKFLVLPKHIIALIKKKRKIRKKYHVTQDKRFKVEFNALNSTIKKEISIFKSNKWKAFCTSLNNFHISDSAFWKKINSIDKSENCFTAPCLNYKESVTSNPKITSSIFADELETVFQNHINDEFDLEFENLVNQTFPRLFETEINTDCHFTNIFEIKSILSCIRGKGSPGPDKITNKALKLLPDPYIKTLVDLINSSMKFGHVPAIWKKALVSMIHKPMKNPKLALSYRPISLLNTLSKLLERVIYTRLLDWCNTHNIISVFQSGFTNGRQSKDNIFRLIQDTQQSFNRNMSVGAVFIDIEKAFDRVWHKGLIFKLSSINVPTYLGSWIKNYLTNRSFQVKVLGELSSNRLIQAGIPQGSILGPILFNIYFNSIVEEITSNWYMNVALYADDLSLWVSSPYINILNKHIQITLNSIMIWMNKWKMVVSETKSVVTLFTSHGMIDSNKLIVYYNGSQLKPDNHPKLLGITFDRGLKFNKNTSIVIRRCRQRLNMLRSIKGKKWGVSSFIILTSYKVLIRSIIDYSSLTIPLLSPTNVNQLEVVQRNAIRIAYRFPLSVSFDQLMVTSKLPCILERSICQIDKYLKKSMKYNNIPVKKNIQNYVQNIDLHEGGTANMKTIIRSTLLGNLLISRYSNSQLYLFNRPEGSITFH